MLPLDVAELFEPLTEGIGNVPVHGRRAGFNESDCGRLRRLLRLDGQRSGEGTSHRGEQEVAPVHYCSENDMSTCVVLMLRVRESRDSPGLPAGELRDA